MRILRSVTFAPIGMFSRTLKVEMALRARVMTGFCPAISARSAAASVTFLVSFTASPTPMFRTILSMTGTSNGFLYPNSSMSCWRTTSS